MRFCSCTNEGISSMQGPHQLVQKFRTMVLPFKSCNETVRSESVRVKSGASEPSMRGCEPRLHAENSRADNRTLKNRGFTPRIINGFL